LDGPVEFAVTWGALLGGFIGAAIPAWLVYLGMPRGRQATDAAAFGAGDAGAGSLNATYAAKRVFAERGLLPSRPRNRRRRALTRSGVIQIRGADDRRRLSRYRGDALFHA
jgi:hypothetical protein